MKHRKQRKVLRIADKQGGLFCNHCKSEDKPLTIDHIIAGADGGLDVESNMQLLCRLCHGKKTKAEIRLRKNKYARNPWRSKYHFTFPVSRGISG